MKFNIFQLKYILFPLLLFLTGCQQKGIYKGTKELIVKPHKKINYKIALKMYVVKVYSENTYNIMKEIDTVSFFNQKKQLMMDHPGELEIQERDLISEDYPKCFVINAKKRYWGLFVFFRYVDNSESKFTYPATYKSIILKLENGTFEIDNISKRELVASNPYLKRKFSEILFEN